MADKSKAPAAVPQPHADTRVADAQRKAAEVNDRAKLLADAAAPGDHPDVLVVKRDEMAAKAEQNRLDIAAAAGAKQKPAEPAPVVPTEGTLPAEFNPAHPVEPSPVGSSPHSPGTPAGPMGEDVIYVTDDIAPDGTPNVQAAAGLAPDMPHLDGENDRDLSKLPTGEGWTHTPATNDEAADPHINSHSPEGAALDEIKLGKPVLYVPNESTLDPTKPVDGA